MSKGVRVSLLMLAVMVALVCITGCGGSSNHDKGEGWFSAFLGFGAGLFVAWSFPFWLLVLGSVIGIAAAIEREMPRSSWATFFTIVTLGLIWWSNPQIGSWVRSHGLVGYLSVPLAVVVPGVVWMIARWKLWTLQCERRYQQAKREWLDRKGVGPEVNVVPDRLKADWAAYVEERSRSHYSGPRIYPKAPHPSQHMSRIIAWGIYWPWSIIGYVLGPLAKERYAILARQLRDLLLSLSLSSYKGVEADFPAGAQPCNPLGADDDR